MRLKVVTVTLLLTIASKGDGRPKDPDPLDGGRTDTVAAVLDNSDSRYMMAMSRLRASNNDRRHDISINRVARYNAGRSLRQRHSIFPGLSFENSDKNYLPLGALSSRKINARVQESRSLRGRSIPLAIPLTPAPKMSTPLPIPISVPRRSRLDKSFFPDSQKYLPVEKSSHGLNSVSTPLEADIITAKVSPHGQRGVESRTLVRIVPQRLKPGPQNRRNFTSLTKIKPDMADAHLKNWPNEVMQNVQDLFNYEKYTSFLDEDIQDRNKEPDDVPNIPYSREPSNNSSEIKEPAYWSAIPIFETTMSPMKDRVDVDSSMQIDNLLDDLGKNNPNSAIPQTSSEVVQNTVVHILNAGSRKPNVTVIEPMGTKKVNKTKPGSIRPPQNVHIMFMDDPALANQSSTKQNVPVQILGNDPDCPTIMINSITQINNTIESKAGCTDLNIVINSHVLNTNIFKPAVTTQTSPQVSSVDSAKNPYLSSPGTSSPDSYGSVSTYPNSNYYGGSQRPENELQADSPGQEVSSLEVFQGTHISIGNEEIYGSNDDSTYANTAPTSDSNADGTPMTQGEENANDVAGSGPTSSGGEAPAYGAAASQGMMPGGAEMISGDAALSQANGASGPINLGLPSIPNIPNVGQVGNLASGGTTGGSGVASAGETGAASVGSGNEEEDDEFEEIVDAMSPITLLESISTAFDDFSAFNPANYGIFGVAMAPVMALAAGIVGVAAFLFPWAFPSSVSFARSWNSDDSTGNVGYSWSVWNMVQSSIKKYTHLNEWKARRRKKRRKR